MLLFAEPRLRASCRPAESERGTDLPTCRCSPVFCEQPPGSRSRGCGAMIELSLARRRLLRRRSVLVVASTPGRAKWDGRASRPSEGFGGGALSAIPCSQPCTSMLVNHALDGRGCFTLHSRPEGFVCWCGRGAPGRLRLQYWVGRCVGIEFTACESLVESHSSREEGAQAQLLGLQTVYVYGQWVWCCWTAKSGDSTG